MAIKYWSVAVHDLTWMVHNDDLSFEKFSIHGWGVLGIGGNITSLDISDRKILNVESNIVTWNSFFDLLVMHLDRFTLSGGSKRTECNCHSWPDDTGFDSTDWDSSDTRDLVNIL